MKANWSFSISLCQAGRKLQRSDRTIPPGGQRSREDRVVVVGLSPLLHSADCISLRYHAWISVCLTILQVGISANHVGRVSIAFARLDLTMPRAAKRRCEYSYYNWQPSSKSR